MKLQSSPKIYNNYKCDYPENTIKKIEEGFKKLGLDITYKEGRVSSSDFSIHSSYAYLDILGWGQEGKGTSRLLSKASAYAELAERFSIGIYELKIPLPKKQGRFEPLLKPVLERRFLRGYENNCNHPCAQLNEAIKYFKEPLSREEYNILKKEGFFNSIVEAYNPIIDKYVKLPINAIELSSSSNGAASGNTIEEAIAQGSFEVFERYAASKIIHENIVCPTINPESIENKDIQKALELYESLNIETIIKDFSLGNKIPVIGALFINHNLDDDKNLMKVNRNHVRIDVGAHLNAEEAIMRCFTELKQLTGLDQDELTFRKKDDILYDIWTKDIRKPYTGVQDIYKFFTVHYDYYGDLFFLKKGEKITISNLKSKIYTDSLDDVNEVINICKNNEWDLSFVDYTHKVLKFPTVRVIIPAVSSDFDRYSRNTMRELDMEKRVNYFYGINDFYSHLTKNDWLNNPQKIQNLIHSIENYLSKELPYYLFKLTRENNYTQILNLFHILPFLYLSINNLEEAKKYFRSLIKLNPHLLTDHFFFKSLSLIKYNQSIYKAYIHAIEDIQEKNTNLDFKLKSNPFDPEIVSDELEDMYVLFLEKINNSYF
jgi:YcaO-like protein with predicted kinase domain